MLHSGLGLPDHEDLLLNEAGTLSLGFGSESGQHPVVALAGLLEKLLHGTDAPESLLALVNENTGSNPKHNAVEGFSRALSFYERPNRTNDLRALVDRLSNRPTERAAEDLEFERLREKVGGKPSDETKPAETEQQSRRRIPKLTPFQQQIAAAGMIAAVLLAIVAIKGSPLRRIEAGYEGVVSGMSGVISGLLNSFGMSAPASAAPATAPSTPPQVASATVGNAAPLEKAVEGPDPKRAATSTPATTPTRNAAGSSKVANPGNGTSGTTPPPPAMPGTMTPGLASRSLSPPTLRAEPATVSPVVPPLAPAVPLLPAGPSGSLVVPSDGVYSPETPGVRPPALLRPQMPREPAPGRHGVLRHGRGRKGDRRAGQVDFAAASLSRPDARCCGESLEVPAGDAERAAREIPRARPDHPGGHAGPVARAARFSEGTFSAAPAAPEDRARYG